MWNTKVTVENYVEMWETLKKTGENEIMKFEEIFPENENDIKQVEEIELEAFGIGAIDKWVIKPISRYGKIVSLKECGKLVGITELMWKWNSKNVYIYSFAVKKMWQNQGCGKLLMEKTIEYLKKQSVEKISLTVSKDNYKAINLYENFGFIKERELFNEYGDGTDKYLMLKDLVTNDTN